MISVYFVNQQFPSFPYKEMLQLSFLIFVQWNIKGNRKDDIKCGVLVVSWQLLRQSGKKHSVQVIFINVHRGRGGKEEQTVYEMLRIL